MKGVSLTLMRVDGNAYGDVPFLELLNDPAATPAWPATLPAHLRSADALSSSTLETRAQAAESAAVSEMAPADRALGSTVTCSAEQGAATAAAIRQACEALLAAVPELTELDRASGDGDCGHTMAAGAESILKGLQPDADAAVALPLTCPPQLLSRLAACMSKFMGGSSGAIYSIMFSAAAGRLAKAEKQASVQDWAEALDAGVQAIALYGGAVRGDRTCLDAFLPATEALLGSLESGEAAKAALTAAAIAARAGAAEVCWGGGRGDSPDLWVLIPQPPHTLDSEHAGARRTCVLCGKVAIQRHRRSGRRGRRDVARGPGQGFPVDFKNQFACRQRPVHYSE